MRIHPAIFVLLLGIVGVLGYSVGNHKPPVTVTESAVVFYPTEEVFPDSVVVNDTLSYPVSMPSSPISAVRIVHVDVTPAAYDFSSKPPIALTLAHQGGGVQPISTSKFVLKNPDFTQRVTVNNAALMGGKAMDAMLALAGNSGNGTYNLVIIGARGDTLTTYLKKHSGPFAPRGTASKVTAVSGFGACVGFDALPEHGERLTLLISMAPNSRVVAPRVQTVQNRVVRDGRTGSYYTLRTYQEVTVPQCTVTVGTHN